MCCTLFMLLCCCVLNLSFSILSFVCFGVECERTGGRDGVLSELFIHVYTIMNHASQNDGKRQRNGNNACMLACGSRRCTNAYIRTNRSFAFVRSSCLPFLPALRTPPSDTATAMMSTTLAYRQRLLCILFMMVLRSMIEEYLELLVFVALIQGRMYVLRTCSQVT